jgi:hypothetical protein
MKVECVRQLKISHKWRLFCHFWPYWVPFLCEAGLLRKFHKHQKKSKVNFTLKQLNEIRQSVDRSSRMKFRGCNHPTSKTSSRSRKSSISPSKHSRDILMEESLRGRKSLSFSEHQFNQFNQVSHRPLELGYGANRKKIVISKSSQCFSKRPSFLGWIGKVSLS